MQNSQVVLFGTSQDEIPKHVFLYLLPVAYLCQLRIAYIAFCCNWAGVIILV